MKAATIDSLSTYLGFGSVFVGGVTAVIAIAAWYFSWKSGKNKDEAFERFRVESRLEVEKLQQSVAVAQQEQAKAKQATAEAMERAANAELEALRLREKLAWRTITPAQCQAISNAMRLWAKDGTDQQRVAVFASTNDIESVRLADAIAAALGEAGAGWNINRYPVQYGKNYAVHSVGVLASSGERGREVAKALVGALKSAGLESFIIEEPRTGTDSAISIIVGQRY